MSITVYLFLRYNHIIPKPINLEGRGLGGGRGGGEKKRGEYGFLEVVDSNSKSELT